MQKMLPLFSIVIFVLIFSKYANSQDPVKDLMHKSDAEHQAYIKKLDKEEQTTEEVRKIAMKHFDKYVVKCGDVYCTWWGDFASKEYDTCLQFTKKGSWVFSNTTDADRLNGFKYKGDVHLYLGGAYRYYKRKYLSDVDLSNDLGSGEHVLRLLIEDDAEFINTLQRGVWSEWKQGGPERLRLDVEVQKKKGGQFETSDLYYDSNLKPITCSDLPK